MMPPLAWLTALVALLAALAGFGALGLALDRHWQGRYGRGTTPGRRRPWLRLGGGAGLLLSLLACLRLNGPTQGWVLWCGMLTAGALAVSVLLSYAPRRAPTLVGGAGGIALLLAGAALAGSLSGMLA